MNWKSYQREFKRAVKEQNLPSQSYDEYVSVCLEYARRLYSRKLPVIFDGNHFCRLVGYNSNFVFAAANAPERFYRRFSVTKRSGGERVIAEPLPSLKEIQRWILVNILSRIKPSRFAKGFRRNFSIKDNAKFHIGQQYIISVDLENFFPSIKFSRIFAVFAECGYSRAVATLLANLCTLENALPQGAPTSPALSNLVAMRLDRRISGYTVSHEYRYTRYADDITISGLRSTASIGAVLSFLNMVTLSEGFSINSQKTRVMRQGQRQEVTGVVVNNKISTPRQMRRRIRQTAYYVEKFGLPSHMERTEIKKRAYVQHLLGKANFVLFMNPEDRDALKLRGLLSNAESLEAQ